MFDTIILGAGSAGCVLAGRLSADPGRRVLLLEAGRAAPEASSIPSDWSTMFNTGVDWGFHTVPQAGCRGRRIFWPRGRMVGGSGALNAMIYMRGLPSDYDGWEELGCPGWSWADVLPTFIASEDNARLRHDPLHGTGGPLHVGDAAYVDAGERLWLAAAEAAGYPRNPDFNGAAQDGVGFYQFTIRDGERWGTAKAYLASALDRPNLAVRTGLLVTRIVIDGGRAVGVEVLERGVPSVLRTEAEIVLALGAVGSCQTLLLSGVGPADELAAVGIACRHDLPGVGKNLQDHINVPITFDAREPVGLGGIGEAAWQAAYAEWRDARTGPRTSPWVAAGGHVRTRPDVEPDIQLYGAMTAGRDYARFLHSGAGVTLHATLQRPRSRGEIRLASADPIEAPLIDPRYFASDPEGTDLATLIEGVRVNRRIAHQSPLREVLAEELVPSRGCDDDASLGHYIRGHCTTLYHAAGTCRMGCDPLAVTDPATLKVHGLEGLHVADAAVIPRMVSANINAPTIMIAERAAAMIAGLGPPGSAP